MNILILDTGIILRNPKVLGINNDSIKIIIPSGVVEELISRADNRGDKHDRRIDLIYKAVRQNSISIVKAGLKDDDNDYNFAKSELSNTDKEILRLAKDFKNDGHIVQIATNDKSIWKAASILNIGLISSDTINDLLKGSFDGTRSDSLQSDIVAYERTQNKLILTAFVIGVITSIAIIYFFPFLKKITETINIWGTALLILIAGIGFFILRERQRLIYGVIEFGVGFIVVVLLFLQDSFHIQNIEFNLDFFLKVSGGLYIMVRGQDNIIKAIRDTSLGLKLKDKYKIGL